MNNRVDSLDFAWLLRVRCSRGEIYILVTAVCVSLCVSVCLPLAAFPHYCTDPDVTWENDRECPLVVHYWTDL